MYVNTNEKPGVEPNAGKLLYWEARNSHYGYVCRHRHRTRDAAQRCADLLNARCGFPDEFDNEFEPMPYYGVITIGRR